MHFPHAVVAVALAAQASAHGILGEITTDGVRNAAFQTDFIYRKQNGNPTPDLIAWSTESLDRGYIEPNSMNTLDINCHVNAEPGALTAQVAAGGKVDFFWPEWPHDVGPVLTYIAACGGDCASAEKSALSWVKIDEAGYDGQWAAEKLMNNNFTWTTTGAENVLPLNDNTVFI
ncbi:Auxiliary Activity family 9 [Fusarium oxysporum f. sp. vasinfectum]|nr:Auxiliary Activity family 9 [Fusarium oxysporum f. sp. vasinfectum]